MSNQKLYGKIPLFVQGDAEDLILKKLIQYLQSNDLDMNTVIAYGTAFVSLDPSETGQLKMDKVFVACQNKSLTTLDIPALLSAQEECDGFYPQEGDVISDFRQSDSEELMRIFETRLNNSHFSEFNIAYDYAQASLFLDPFNYKANRYYMLCLHAFKEMQEAEKHVDKIAGAGLSPLYSATLKIEHAIATQNSEALRFGLMLACIARKSARPEEKEAFRVVEEKFDMPAMPAFNFDGRM